MATFDSPEQSDSCRFYPWWTPDRLSKVNSDFLQISHTPFPVRCCRSLGALLPVFDLEQVTLDLSLPLFWDQFAVHQGVDEDACLRNRPVILRLRSKLERHCHQKKHADHGDSEMPLKSDVVSHLEVIEPELLLRVLEVALNAPATERYRQ